MALPEDIVTKVLHDFGEDDGILVLRVLQSLHNETPEPPVNDRVLRCLVAVAKGSLKKFSQTIEATRVDWRDVIIAAEGWGRNAQLMAYPFPLHLDQDLCRRWMIGQKVLLPWIADGAPPWKIEAGDIRKLELRRLQREDPPDGEVLGADAFLATIRMLCARGQPLSSSPAFEIWLAVWYSIDHETKTFALRRMKYNPNEIKQRGKWD